MREQGNLLIELVMVIFVLSILFCATLPRSAIVERLALENEAWHLASDLRWLQQYSMNIAKGHIKVSAAGHDAIPKMRFIFGENSSYTISTATVIMRKHVFKNNVVLTGNINAISFNTDGHINQLQTIYLFQQNRSKHVVIDRAGRIRVE